jgi:predicted enzyme related to lactoylglutathione lyase
MRRGSEDRQAESLTYAFTTNNHLASKRPAWHNRDSYFRLPCLSCLDDVAMSDLVEPETLAANGNGRLELFMTVVRVTDWSTIVPWYINTLGMVPVLIDAEHEFALLAAGDSRLGFKGLKSNCTAHERTKVRFVFQVDDVDRERHRLTATGVVVSTPFDNREEGFREVRLHDPEGNSLTLFSWIDPTHEGRFSRGRQ